MKLVCKNPNKTKKNKSPSENRGDLHGYKGFKHIRKVSDLHKYINRLSANKMRSASESCTFPMWSLGLFLNSEIFL